MEKRNVPLVSLVGAGPGDPDLITIKGLIRLQEADVVIYDALIALQLLEHTRPEAVLISAGKWPGNHLLDQAEINAALVQYAQAGLKVVRLKGGDPFVFGRGGEEAEALAQANVTFEVIPGVSSAIAAPAYAGIPITDRNCASAFAVITGHRKHGKEDVIDQDWDALARIDTLVILMGMANLAQIVDRLVQAGRALSTPVAIIQWGTTSHQVAVWGTLADIVERAQELTSPATIVIGEVVSLGKRLQWFSIKSNQDSTNGEHMSPYRVTASARHTLLVNGNEH